MSQSTSVIIVVDHHLFGDCLAAVLTQCTHCTVLALVQTPEEALHHMQAQPVDVILIDEQLPQATALPLTRQLTHDFPTTRVLILGATECEARIQESIEAGASGYVLKDTPFDQLQAVIELLARGETVCSPHLAHRMFTRLSELAETSARSTPQEPTILSDREIEILRWIAEGWSNRQIADHLCLSPHTVKNHVHNILKKLRVQRRLEAIKYAAERQWWQQSQEPIHGHRQEAKTVAMHNGAHRPLPG